MPRLTCLTVLLLSVWFALPGQIELRAQDGTASKHWMIILVGIPGEAKYEQQYQGVAAAWQKTFTEDWKVPAEQVVTPKMPLTADSIRQTIADVAGKAKPNDSFWLLTIGHGDDDGRQARFHVQGRDPTEEDWPRWLTDVKCREQVLCFTHSSSGPLLKPLSKPGRIVITATAAQGEENETEFPYALANVWQSPAKDSDTNGDGRVSFAELFPHVVAGVNARFMADKRLPTEHAQLDDNGDGVGSEELAVAGDTSPTNAKKDGAAAAQVFLPWPVK